MEKYISLGDKLSLVVAVVGGAVASVFGDINTIFKVLVLLMVLDVITGLVKAFVEKTVDSKVMREGIAKKILILVIVAVGHIFDLILIADIKIRDMCIMFYICEEMLSILENGGKFIKYPEYINKALKQLQDKTSKGE